MKLNEDIMRVLTIKVDKHEEGPSIMMRAKTKNDDYSTDMSDKLESQELTR